MRLGYVMTYAEREHRRAQTDQLLFGRAALAELGCVELAHEVRNAGRQVAWRGPGARPDIVAGAQRCEDKEQDASLMHRLTPEPKGSSYTTCRGNTTRLVAGATSGGSGGKRPLSKGGQPSKLRYGSPRSCACSNRRGTR